MRFDVPTELDDLAPYIDRFFAIAGRERWFRRAEQLWGDAQASPYLQKIVADYHWLELAMCHQWDVHHHEGQLLGSEAGVLENAALQFAATTVEVHSRLSAKGRQVLQGRLVDSLKAETGFASLYLELHLAALLSCQGYEVEFSDMEGHAQFDLSILDGVFEGEVECKSISADAGRQIHRKDFYRFAAAAHALLSTQAQLDRREVVVITLPKRLDPSDGSKTLLLESLRQSIASRCLRLESSDSIITRQPFEEVVPDARVEMTPQELHSCLKSVLGQCIHVAGAMTASSGYLLVMRSEREDDASAPLLESMRKAASQLTGTRPGYVAIQEHGIDGLDLLLPHVQRRMRVLSSALFDHYGCTHVNAVLVTPFGSFGSRDGQVGVPVMVFPNARPKFQVTESRVALLEVLSTEEMREAMTTPPFRRRRTAI